MGPLSLKLAVLSLIGLLGLAIVGPSSPANAANVICDGDCSRLDIPDLGDGSVFNPVVLGIETTSGDQSLKVKTRGNVYLVGPISAAKASMLKATNIIIGVPSMVPENIKLKTQNLLASFPSFIGGSNTAGADARTRLRDKRGKKVMVKSNGDLYVDISKTDLMKLKIRAGGTIFVSDTPLTPVSAVPEPSTAILMAMGLVGLSLKRVRSGA